MMEIGEGFEEAHTTIIYTPTLFINAIGDQRTNPEWGLTLIAGGFNPRKWRNGNRVPQERHFDLHVIGHPPCPRYENELPLVAERFQS